MPTTSVTEFDFFPKVAICVVRGGVRSMAMGSNCCSVVVVDESAQILAAHDRPGCRHGRGRRQDHLAAQCLVRPLGQIVMDEHHAAVAQCGFICPDGFAQDAVFEGFDEAFNVSVLPGTSDIRLLYGDLGLRQALLEGVGKLAVMVHADTSGLMGGEEAVGSDQGMGAVLHEDCVGFPGGDTDDGGSTGNDVDGEQDIGATYRVVVVAKAHDPGAEVDRDGVGVVCGGNDGIRFIASSPTIGRWWYSMAVEDVADAAVRGLDAELIEHIADGSPSPGIVAPGIFLGHGDDQGHDRIVDARFAAGVGDVGSDVCAVPAAERVCADDGGIAGDMLPAGAVAKVGQSTALVVVEIADSGGTVRAVEVAFAGEEVGASDGAVALLTGEVDDCGGRAGCGHGAWQAGEAGYSVKRSPELALVGT